MTATITQTAAAAIRKRQPITVFTLAPVAKAGMPKGPSSANAIADSPHRSTPTRRPTGVVDVTDRG